MKKKPCICKTSLISNIYSFLISVTFAISKIRSKGNQRQLSYSFKIKDVYRGEDIGLSNCLNIWIKENIWLPTIVRRDIICDTFFEILDSALLSFQSLLG